MTTRICNKCGKEIDEHYESMNINHKIGYGSKYDDARLEIDLCNECLDEWIDWLRSQCKYDIIVENS